LPIFGPRDLIGHSHQVPVDRKERTLLRQTERQRIHAHAPGTFPLVAAGIVANALQVEDALPQMPNRIASVEQDLIADSLAQQRIQIGDDLRVRPVAI
jgi:hypothetical protein